MRLRDLYRDECGATLVEFTLVLTLFIGLTFGIIQAGLMLFTLVGLQHGVEMASRCASLSDIAMRYANLDPSVNSTQCYTTNGDAAANSSTVKSFAANNSWGTN